MSTRNKTRDKITTLRMTTEEYNFLTKRAKEKGISKGQYIRLYGLNFESTPTETRELKKKIERLKRVIKNRNSLIQKIIYRLRKELGNNEYIPSTDSTFN
jgi:DNA gyrase/topoisomerase IV subunit A